MIEKNKLYNIKSTISIIISIVFLLLLPFLFTFLINVQYKKIASPPESYYKNIGIVDDLGITTKIVRARITSKTPTFFVKIKDNDVIFSYSKWLFNRNYEEITNNLKKGDSVTIYHEGFDKRQNTVNIIQLEKSDTVIISKTPFNKKETGLLVWFFVCLLMSLFPLYMFVVYGHWRQRIKQ